MEHLAVFQPFPSTFHFPLHFPTFISVIGACLPRVMGAHGWVVRFCQPSVHFLHLGAGCQYWKLQDGSGTQPPHINTVADKN